MIRGEAVRGLGFGCDGFNGRIWERFKFAEIVSFFEGLEMKLLRLLDQKSPHSR